MPYLAGEDELQLMKLSPETSNIPVIVVTAKPEADVRQEEEALRRMGVVNIVYKPFDLNQLVHVVKQTIG
jgi:response regulator RpfG family c-di-GMP phosphodiesterase